MDTAAASGDMAEGEIKNLDMPGITMLFQVKDAAMLDMLKAGHKLKFKAYKSSGGIVVTEIQVSKWMPLDSLSSRPRLIVAAHNCARRWRRPTVRRPASD